MNEMTIKEAREKGEELYKTDNGDPYSWSVIALYKVGAKYAMFFDSGCSCNGEFEMDDHKGDVYTKSQLRRVTSNWKDTGDEQEMRVWIKDNL
jgi:hypothetical protein